MSAWGQGVYGDPCRECGYEWGQPLDHTRSLVAALPDRYRVLVDGALGTERHPSLTWSVTAYVAHVADNLRVWSERLAAMALAPGSPLVSYDENDLAAARSYEAMPLAGALWSLGRSVDGYLAGLDLAEPTGAVMLHPECGELTLAEITGQVLHDAHHHAWDIERSRERPPT
jgi:hypothetical protein